jgi:N-methylhydantoinase B/oxoprolinase/acetone carboxylase alpha subunit
MSSNQATSDAEQALVNKFLNEHRSYLAPDQEIQKNHHINPRSEREDEILSRGVDSHRMADIRSSLQAALDEAFDIAEMTVATPAAQCGDMSTGYFTAGGDLSLGSTRGIAAFTVSLHYPIRYINKYFAEDETVGVRPGDAFLINDCHYGGVHNPDQHMFMPLFDDKEQLVAWCCCALHEGEIGAKVPGGMGPNVETIWDEGFRGSPIKIVENYRLKRDLVTLVQNNSREPELIGADLKARLSTCLRLKRRFDEQVEQHGIDNMIGFQRGNVEFVAREARRRIAALPDGTVRTVMYVDSTMREPAMIRININFTIKGDTCTIDTRGSAPEIYNRPVNSLQSTFGIGLVMALGHYIWPDLPAGQATTDCFKIVTEPDTINNCSQAVPTALCMQAAFKMITATEIAMAKFYHGAPRRYAKTKAGWFNQPQSIIYGGLNQYMDSVGNMCGELNGMGGGARFDCDGEHSLAPCFGGPTDLGETEAAEDKLPFIYALSKKLWPDNVGYGKYRGGAGYQFGLMRFGDQPFGFQGFTCGSYFPSTQGLFGGYACPTYAVCRVRGKNLFEDFKQNPELFEADMFAILNEQPYEGAHYESLEMAVPFELYPEGELFMQSQGCGGGYGDVLERDPGLVIKDIEENLISQDTAVDLYRVVFDPVTLVIDHEATAQRKEEERRARLERGSSWDEFVTRHVRPEPPSTVLYFGNWNESEELYAGPYGKGLAGQLPPIILPDPLVVENQNLKAQLAELQAQRNAGGDIGGEN